MTTVRSLQQVILMASIACCAPSAHAVIVYTEDFSSNSLNVSSARGTIGFFNDNVAFGEISVAENASVADGVLTVNTTGGFRGIGIAFDEATLTDAALGGADTFEFSFDVVGFDPGVNGPTVGTGTGQVSIHSADGFQTGSDANNVVLSAQTGMVEAQGVAVTEELVIQDFDTIVNNVTLSFNYSGSGAVIIYLGANTTSFPFPTVMFDNLELRTETVPEPSSLVLMMLSSVLVWRRKRSH